MHDILLIAFALAWAQFSAPATRRSVLTLRATGATRTLAPDIDLSHTVGWFTARYPVALNVGGPVSGLDWAQVVAGQAGLGALIKDAKEQLRALPDPLTYGVLRYLNAEVELTEPDPPIGFNYLGRVGAPAEAWAAGDVWRICVEGVPVTDAATAVPMPLGAHRGGRRRHRGH